MAKRLTIDKLPVIFRNVKDFVETQTAEVKNTMGDILTRVASYVDSSVNTVKEEILEVIDPRAAVTFIMSDGTEVSLQGTKVVKSEGADFELLFPPAVAKGYKSYGSTDWFEALTSMEDLKVLYSVDGASAMTGSHIEIPGFYTLNMRADATHSICFTQLKTADSVYDFIVDRIEVPMCVTGVSSGRLKAWAYVDGVETDISEEVSVPAYVEGKLPPTLTLDVHKRVGVGQINLSAYSDDGAIHTYVIGEIRVKGHVEKHMAYSYGYGADMIGEWDDPAAINEENDETGTLS